MIHHRECLTLGLEACNHLLGVHTELDDLEGHLPANRLLLLRHVHGPEPAFANGLQDPVAADHRSRSFLLRSGARCGIGWHVCRDVGRRGEELAGAIMYGEQLLDPRAKVRPARACAIEIGRTLPGRPLNGFREDFLGRGRGVHGRSLRGGIVLSRAGRVGEIAGARSGHRSIPA